MKDNGRPQDSLGRDRGITIVGFVPVEKATPELLRLQCIVLLGPGNLFVDEYLRAKARLEYLTIVAKGVVRDHGIEQIDRNAVVAAVQAIESGVGDPEERETDGAE